jgi:hypothetical protein
MLYDWQRSSTLPMRGMVAGVRGTVFAIVRPGQPTATARDRTIMPVQRRSKRS